MELFGLGFLEQTPLPVSSPIAYYPHEREAYMVSRRLNDPQKQHFGEPEGLPGRMG